MRRRGRLSRLPTLARPRMMRDVLADLLTRQPRRVLASRIGQRAADRLGVLEARNIVTAEAAVLGDAAASHVHKQSLRLRLTILHESRLRAADATGAGHWNSLLDILPRPLGGEFLLEEF